jgi:hypothetical protein
LLQSTPALWCPRLIVSPSPLAPPPSAPQPDFIEKSVPVVPISGWMGDNLIKKSTNMTWWEGVEVKTLDNRTCKVETLLDALNGMVVVPERKVRGAAAAAGRGGGGRRRLWWGMGRGPAARHGRRSRRRG